MPIRYEGFAGGDRTSLLVPAPQSELLQKLVAVGKRVVVVLTTGSAISFDTKLANGILLSWYSGEQSGNAVAEALLGETNPAGRLLVIFNRSDKDLPKKADPKGTLWHLVHCHLLFDSPNSLSAPWRCKFSNLHPTLQGSRSDFLQVLVKSLSPAAFLAA